jgi:hypothetical protein
MRLVAEELPEIMRQAFEAPSTLAFTVITAIFLSKLTALKLPPFIVLQGYMPTCEVSLFLMVFLLISLELLENIDI